MDNQVILRLEQATEALVQIFSQPSAVDKMDMVEKLLQVRELCLQRFDQDIRPFMNQPAVKARLHKILERDRLIEEGMQKLKDEAQLQLRRVKASRHAQTAYEGGVDQEALFFDKEY